MQCLIIFISFVGLGDDFELFDSDFAISNFDLNNVLANSAIFDEKLVKWSVYKIKLMK